MKTTPTPPVRASVLVPTHDHASTLPLTVRSVLDQRVAEVEVLLIGDGVTAELRQVIAGLCDHDDRVRFLDFPKGPHHGEIYRHEAVLAARSDAIFYLCDDDLLLPDHVGDLLALLEDADLVQCRNGYLGADGTMELYPTDLSDPECVAWHLLEPHRNMTSLTGTAHTRRAYLALDDPWETTPSGEWPDHFQWKKFMRRPGFRGATSHRMTALQLPTHLADRASWSPEERRTELERWARLVAASDGQERIDRLVDRATQRALAGARPRLDQWRHGAASLQELLATERDRTARLRRRRDRLRARVDAREQELADRDLTIAALTAEIEALRASSSWRWTAPARGLAARLRRRPPAGPTSGVRPR